MPANLKAQLITDFTYGLNLKAIEGMADPRHCVDCDGTILDSLGGVSKWPGRTSKVTGFAAPVTKLFEYENSAGVITLLAYTDDGATATIWTWTPEGSKSSLGTVTAGGEIDHAQFEGLTVIVGTKFAPQKYNGSVLAALAGWAPSYSTQAKTEISDADTAVTPGANPSLVEPHANRLWFSGDADNPSTVYYSALFTAETWTNTGSVERGGWLHINPKDGKGKITAIISWQDRLVVFKERAIYFIEGTGPRSVGALQPFNISQTVLPVGTNSRHSLVKQSNDLVFFDNNNQWRSIINTIKNAEAEGLILSYLVQSQFDLVPDKAQKYVIAADYVLRNQIWAAHHKDYSEYTLHATNTRALYHLDSVNDSTSNGYTLTNTGSTPFRLGFNNYLQDAADFNGSSMRLARTSAVGAALTALTFKVWVKPDALPSSGNTAYIGQLSHSTGRFAMYLHNDGGTQKVKFSVWDTTPTEQIAISTTTLSTTDPSWLVGTWDGTTVKVYVNGTVGATTAACASIDVSQTNGFSLASSSASANSNLFDGKIDEVELRTDALAADVISSYYASVTTGNNRVSVLDYGKEAKPWMRATNIIKPASVLYSGRKFYTGTYDGAIHLQDDGNTHGSPHGTSRREGYFTTVWLDGKAPFNQKKVRELVIWLTAFSDGKMNIETSWDDRSGNIYPITLDATAETTWGDNWTTELIWSSGVGRKLYKFRVRPSGHGRLFQVRFFGWEEAVQWTIVRGEVHWEIMGTR